MKNKYLYRIFRLRRLIVVSLIVLFSQWAIGWYLFGPSALLEAPVKTVSVAVICAATILALVMVYPRVWWETLTTALVLGFVLSLLPIIEGLHELPSAQNLEMAVAWVIFCTVFGSIFLWLGLNWLPGTLLEIPLGLRQWTSRVRYDMPADRAFQVLKTTPDSDDGKYKTSPLGEDGFITVTTRINTVNPDTWDPEIEELIYKCKIETEGDSYQVTSNYFMVEDEANVDVERLSVFDVGQAAMCETRSVRSRRNLYEDLGFWIQDYGADHLYGRLAESDGKPSVALVDLPYITPLVGLARFFQRFSDDTPGRSGGAV